MPIASRDSAHLLDRYFLLARKAVSDLPPLALLAVKFSIYEAPHAQARSLAGQEARAEPRRARRARRGAAGRRANPRYAFRATAEVISADPAAKSKARVRDLSQQGCYLDTDNPLPLGTAAEVRMTKGAQSLEVQGRVVYNQPGKGMGLMF